MAGRFWALPKNATLPAKTKVDERRERQEYDRRHPWRPMTEKPGEGVVCQLLMAATGGDSIESSKRYFLAEDGGWYEVDAQEKLWSRVMNWREHVPREKLPPARRDEIVRRANRQRYFGGRYLWD